MVQSLRGNVGGTGRGRGRAREGEGEGKGGGGQGRGRERAREGEGEGKGGGGGGQGRGQGRGMGRAREGEGGKGGGRGGQGRKETRDKGDGHSRKHDHSFHQLHLPLFQLVQEFVDGLYHHSLRTRYSHVDTHQVETCHVQTLKPCLSATFMDRSACASSLGRIYKEFKVHKSHAGCVDLVCLHNLSSKWGGGVGFMSLSSTLLTV